LSFRHILLVMFFFNILFFFEFQSAIFLVMFFFVLLPEEIRRFLAFGMPVPVIHRFFNERIVGLRHWHLHPLTKAQRNRLKWLDIKEVLSLAFGRVPQFQYNAQVALALAMIFTYLALKADPDSIASLLMYVLSLTLFVYLAHLFSDELFDTFWNSVITLFSFYIIYSLISGMINFVFVETDWTIIWKNRRMLLVGPYFVHPITGSEIWRLWPPFYLLMAILGSAYGSLGEKRLGFLIPYAIFSIACIILLVYEADYYSTKADAMVSNRGYDYIKSLILLVGGLGLGAGSFFWAHYRYHGAEEYKIKYFQNLLVYFTVFSFIVSIMVLDPPGDDGVKPSAWGGLVLNLIFASSAIVVGFGLGIALAFGRRSNLPVFFVPSVAIIELIRAGPLVAWLFFAQILLPDMINPVWEADIAARVIIVLSLFFGCYLAEVLRGGLQAVPYGQYEAATALGLSPLQIKLQIELPQAIRTTLPAIVSQVIGMLKDTSLVYFFGIYDAFRVAKDLPAQWDFIGQHEQALLFVGVVFWILSFYLSKVSGRIEKNLGLTHEGGGEAT